MLIVGNKIIDSFVHKANIALFSNELEHIGGDLHQVWVGIGKICI